MTSKQGFVKTEAEIEAIGEGGKILNQILRQTARLAKPGVSTWQLNKFAEQSIQAAGGKPSFKGFGGSRNPFPAALCTSINSVVVHGIPSKTAILKNGDTIGLDIGMVYKNLYTDTAITVGVGGVSELAKRLMQTTKQALDKAILEAKAGNRIGDISSAIQSTAQAAGFSVVRDLVGHGVGYEVHEDPPVPCFGQKGQGLKLQNGMVLAIEPMLCEKDYFLVFEPDGWTISTKDGGLSAHFEHTIAVEKNGARILT